VLGGEKGSGFHDSPLQQESRQYRREGGGFHDSSFAAGQ